MREILSFLSFMSLIFLFYFLFYIAPHIPWKCLIGKHKWMYAGRKSSMTFKENRRGVNGGERSIFKCANCRAEK